MATPVPMLITMLLRNELARDQAQQPPRCTALLLVLTMTVLCQNMTPYPLTLRYTPYPVGLQSWMKQFWKRQSESLALYGETRRLAVPLPSSSQPSNTQRSIPWE